MKLYEIDAAIQEILDGMTVDEETGEVILDAEALEALQMARAEKLEGAALAVKNLEAEAAAIEAEEKKLAARKTAAKNRAKSIREWIAYNIGTDKLSTPRVSMSVRPGVSSARSTTSAPSLTGTTRPGTSCWTSIPKRPGRSLTGSPS